MAKEFSLPIKAHPSIYEPGDRTLDTFFCIPDQGINSQTGVLLLIAGFGGHAESNVYKKMRVQFADAYNLVTVQCNYFGYEFMQQPQTQIFEGIETLHQILTPEQFNQVYHNNYFDIDQWTQMNLPYHIEITAFERLNETLSNFNDMGIMQALDNITALMTIIINIYQSNHQINTKNIICYGHSHGAYLGYLCNIFAPTLFSLIIDNSAWLIPSYLTGMRAFISQYPNLTFSTCFNYLASKYPFDVGLLNLSSIYKKISNQCNIIAFHGTSDNLIHHTEKEAFCKSLNSCIYREIGQEQIDGEIFRSTNHGLDADFFKLFDYVMQKQFFNPQTASSLELPNLMMQTKLFKYQIDYSTGIPQFSRKTITGNVKIINLKNNNEYFG